MLFSAYAKVGDARNLASVIGEDELSPLDKKYLEFGIDFEQHYIGEQLIGKILMIFTCKTFSDTVLHQTGKRWQDIDRRID